MSEHEQGNAEEVIGSAVSVPLNIITGIAHLLVSKGVISREEVACILQDLAELSPTHGQNEEMVRMMLEPLLVQFENRPPSEHDH